MKLIHQSSRKKVLGVTLIELVMVMVLLGVMAVGIGGFMKLATQTYVNVSSRDELIASARFVVERLNREVRNAVPNTVDVTSNGQCLEFIPIEASSIYVDLAVAPDSPSTNISVIDFNYLGNAPYVCGNYNCNDLKAIVYPLDSTINGAINPPNALSIINIAENSIHNDVLDITTANYAFPEHSPTQRIYFGNSVIEYCVTGGVVNRTVYSMGKTNNPTGVLMAENLAVFDESAPPFIISPATLQRNALVQIHLAFENNDESIVFNNEIHVQNVP